MSLPAFGIRKPVVANLLTVVIIGAGILFGLGLRREFFPEVRPTNIVVAAPYPGASPDEVERSLTVKIENALIDKTDIIKEITSTSSEGASTVVIELREGVDAERSLQEIEREVDALDDLPEAAEQIVVDKLEPNLPVISMSILAWDGASERELKGAIKGIRDDLESLPGMGVVSFSGVREDELTVEVRPAALVEHGLSLPAVAELIRAAMIELPGGSISSESSNYALRGLGAEQTAEAVRGIVVKAESSGQVVRVGDIAEVRLGFVDVDLVTRLNGRRAVSATVFKEGKQDIVSMAEQVKAYVAGRNGEELTPNAVERFTLGLARFAEGAKREAAHAKAVREARVRGEVAPVRDVEAEGPVDTPALLGGVSARYRAWALGRERASVALPGELITTTDLSRYVVGRLELLTRNALAGGIAVFCCLLFFMNWRTAVWVTTGLLVSLCGTLVMMRLLDVSLNLLTMFGLIVVLGILVDDAIVIAENIEAEHARGVPAMQAGIDGANRVAWPVVGTVLTTIFSFLPLALIQGQIGDFLRIFPIVVSCALSVSLVEALLILPAHMVHAIEKNDREVASGRRGLLYPLVWLTRGMEGLATLLFRGLLQPGYVWVTRRVLPWRYLAASVVVGGIVLASGLVAGGRVKFIFFESEDAETLSVELVMPVGTPLAETERAIAVVERAVLSRLDGRAGAGGEAVMGEVQSAWTQLGAISALDGTGGSSATHIAQMILELKPVEFREDNGLMSSGELTAVLRDEAAILTGVESLRIESQEGGPGGASITLAVTGPEAGRVTSAVEEIKAALATYDGVADISDNAESGRRELTVELLDGAAAMGRLNRLELNRQVQAFAFGIEAYSFAGDREDIDVRVRLPEGVRSSLSGIESMYVATPMGEFTPLREVARVSERDGFSAVRRLNGQRTVTVSADVLEGRANPEEITAAIQPVLREVEERYPGVQVLARGRQQDVAEAFASFPLGLAVAFALVFGCLAWLFQSYSQPVIIMTAIPFSIIGMIGGHWVMGYSMTFLSLIGFIALSGIVVNDSIVFMEFVNQERQRGASMYVAVVNAGRARIRAILLTTLTTVLGLAPLILERSFQAKFLIPMAITISFGLMSATVIILGLLPCLLLIVEDMKWLAKGMWTGVFGPRDYLDPRDPDEAGRVSAKPAGSALAPGGGVIEPALGSPE